MTFSTSEHFTSFTPPNGIASGGSEWKTYYRKVTCTDASAPTTKESESLPLVIVAGGPLIGHDYCMSMQELAAHPNISFVLFYDQIGCGRSTHCKTIPEFWKTNIAQLYSLLQAEQLGCGGGDFYLFGHSMGTLLAERFTVEYPEGIRRLVLANAIASFADARASTLEILKDFPPAVRHSIIDFEEYQLGERKTVDTSLDQYLHAVAKVRAKHFNRNPMPSAAWNKSMQNVTEVMDTFATIAGGKIMMLWGGELSLYSAAPVLHRIKAPTLVIKGEFDQTGPMCQEPLLENIPDVQEVTLEDASHILQDEVPHLLNKAVGDFIATVPFQTTKVAKTSAAA